jgi:hypothetical protein
MGKECEEQLHQYHTHKNDHAVCGYPSQRITKAQVQNLDIQSPPSGISFQLQTHILKSIWMYPTIFKYRVYVRLESSSEN